ncbi:MAG: hypothetical protein J6T10_24530 [Methanobrevibacter sp.]|nr:hypothetical protein [Methanobrevibacter sp.]
MTNVEKYYLILYGNYEYSVHKCNTLEDAKDIAEILGIYYNSWFIVKGIEVLNSDD